MSVVSAKLDALKWIYVCDQSTFFGDTALRGPT